MLINKEELLAKLERKYGNLTDDSGCSIPTGNGYEWFSVMRIVEIINGCVEYEE